MLDLGNRHGEALHRRGVDDLVSDLDAVHLTLVREIRRLFDRAHRGDVGGHDLTNHHERRRVDVALGRGPGLRFDEEHEGIAFADLLLATELDADAVLLVIEQRRREHTVPHPFELVAGDVAITLKRVDGVSGGAVEPLVDGHLADADVGEIEVDQRPHLVRRLIPDFDRA